MKPHTSPPTNAVARAIRRPPLCRAGSRADARASTGRGTGSSSADRAGTTSLAAGRNPTRRTQSANLPLAARRYSSSDLQPLATHDLDAGHDLACRFQVVENRSLVDGSGDHLPD